MVPSYLSVRCLRKQAETVPQLHSLSKSACSKPHAVWQGATRILAMPACSFCNQETKEQAKARGRSRRRHRFRPRASGKGSR